MSQFQAEGLSPSATSERDSIVTGGYRTVGKRVLDLVVCAALLPIILPVIALLALLVALSDGGRPFFRHARVGRGGAIFKCWKLRSMVPDAEAKLAAHLAANPAAAREWEVYRKLTDDPRVTRIGEFLRRTSLDELPQIVNVLCGEMSFVGPRPFTPDELDMYGPARNAYWTVRPGITGLWQVSGRNDVSYDERVRLDTDYLRRISLAVDVAIMLRTAVVVVRPTGR